MTGTKRDTDERRAPVATERRGLALWVRIDREHCRNALNTAVLEGIGAALDRAEADEAVRAVVLTGTGERAFCAGADLSAGTEAFSATAREPTTDFGRLARRARECGKPVIARVNGACVAGGMAVLALCDLAVAADHARFGLPEVQVGVFPAQVLVYLRHMVPRRFLDQLCLTGELVDADTACRMGLVNEAVPAARLDERVERLVGALAAGSPAAIARGRYTRAAMETMSFAEALAFAETQIAVLAAGDDAREGIAAFTERRPARWARDAESDTEKARNAASAKDAGDGEDGHA